MAPLHGAQHECNKTFVTPSGGVHIDLYPSDRRLCKRSDAAIAHWGAFDGNLAPSL